MSKRSDILLWVIGIAVIAVIFIVASRSSGNSPEKEAIEIGFIGPLTGDVSGLGTASRAAVEIAAEEINGAGGINGRPLKVVYEDGRCLPGPATSAAQKLISVDKVAAIVGGLCSSETSAFAPNAMENKVVTISYCSSAPPLSRMGKYFFRTYPSDSFQGKFAADFAYDSLGARKIAIIYHLTDWGTGIKDVFAKQMGDRGGAIVAVEGATQEAKDYRTQIAKVKAAGFDHVYIPVYADGGEVLVKQLVEAGVATDKIIGTEVFNDPKFLADTAGYADGIVLTASKISPSEGFKQKMAAKTGGKEVPICAPEAYDAVTALAGGLKKSLDPDSMQTAIRAEEFTGESGPISFDENGDLKEANYVVKKIEAGAAVDLPQQ